MKKSIFWVVIIALAIGALIVWSQNTNQLEPSFEVGVLHPLDQVKGNRNSKVIFTEYSDFECPACRAYYPITKELAREFSAEVAFVYRNFPLKNIHRNAEAAAIAAESADKQGKFWEMHDLLFEKQNEWSKIVEPEKKFIDYALLLGISTDEFSTDIQSEEIADLVDAQRVHAIKSGLPGTPSFFVNKEQIKNPSNLEEFRTVIKKALAENNP